MFPVNIEHPITTTILPASGKTIRIRPFLEKERKLLLMVAEGTTDQKYKDIMAVIRQIASNCLIDPIDLDIIPSIDFEWLFLKLRVISMGEIVKRTFICHNSVNDKNCGGVMNVDLDLSKVDVLNIDVNKVIIINPNVSIKMKLPTVTMEEPENENDPIIDCIEYVASREQIYYTKDYSKTDLNDFISTLSLSQFEMLEDFYNNTPLLETVVHTKCPKCSFNHEIIIQGLENFFV